MPRLRYEFPKCRLYLCIRYDIINLFNEHNLKEYLFHLTKQAKICNNDTYRTVEEIFNSGAVTKSHEKSYEGNANKCEEYDNISNKTNIINNNKITLNSSKKQNGTY